MSYLHHECELERHIVEQLAASGEASMRPRLIAVDDPPLRNRLLLLAIWHFLRGLCAHTSQRVRVKPNTTRHMEEMRHVFSFL